MIDDYKKARVCFTGALLLALSATLPARADYQSTVLSQGPVGYWQLTETTPSPAPITTAANLGSVAVSGTYNGSSGYFRGQPGALADSSTSAHMDGAAQNITVPYDAALNPVANFTIEGWLKADGASAQCPLSCAHATSPRTGWFFYQTGSTGYEIRMYYNSGNSFYGVVGNIANVVGVWTHVVATYDGTTARLYLNGSLANSTTIPSYVPGTDGIFSIGMRSDEGFPWAGGADEVAFYPSVLTAGEIAAHYANATANPASYVSFVTGKSPLLYLRLNEAGNTPAAAAAGPAGEYTSGSTPGQVGPRPVAYPGFDAGNNSTLFSSAGGSVAVPALNLNADTVTISGWVKPSGAQSLGAGLVVCNGGGTYGGLIMDPAYGGLGLGYQWGSTPNNVSFNVDLGLPPLTDSQWSYVALVIRPTEAAIYICDYLGNWSGATNGLLLPINNASQPFSAATLIGMDGGYTTRNFNGNLDEVAIWNRALGAGELFTQYATAVGGKQPQVFADLQPPPLPIAAGDPIVLTVDAGGTAPLTFIWHSTSGAPDVVTTTSTLVISSASLSDTGDYSVTITNASGSASSGPVPVSVVTPTPPVATEWVGFKDRTLYKGGSLKLAVAATGGGLKYKWYKGGSPIAGATASAYIIPAVTNTDAGSFSVYVTNSVGTLSNGPVVITIPNMASNSYAGVVITAGPEAWWRMDGTAGSTNMFDGMGRHDGIYTNAAGGATLPTMGADGAIIGDANTAVTFSSAGQGIGLAPYSPAFGSSKSTIEAWVKTTVTTGQTPVSSSYGSGGWWVSSEAGWWWGQKSDGTFGNNNPDGTNIIEYAAIIPNVWRHVVVTYDITQTSAGTVYPFRFWVNGKTDGYIYGGTRDVNSGGPFIIGGRGVSATTLVDRLFDGTVDEVCYYTRVLSAAEITNHFVLRGSEVIAPAFTTPMLSQTVTTGKSVTFAASALGTAPISLYWYKGTPGAAAPIATGTSTLVINPTALGDTGTYSIVASNSAGMATNTASLTVISPVGYANVTNNLVLHLKFDGDLTDSSGRGNNATAVGSPTIIAGTVGSGAFHVNTDTTNSIYNYATLGANLPADLAFGTSGNFSIVYWIRLAANAAPGDLPVLCSSTNSYGGNGISIAPSYQRGGWSWSLNSTGLYGPDNSINNGNWHCVITTFDRTASALTYLDGVLVNTRSISSAGNVDQPGPMNIGQGSTGTYAESGAMDIDDLGVWGRLLTPLDAAQIESAGRAGRSFDTVAPPSVVIGVSRTGSSVTFTWTQGTLLQADAPDAPSGNWTPVPGAAAPSYTFTPATTGSKYYKVLLPP